jgi:hypothetical protein
MIAMVVFLCCRAAPIIRFESCFGHITPIVTVGRALLELKRRYGKLRRLPTKE